MCCKAGKKITALLYPAKLWLIIEREIKIFHSKQMLKELMTTKPALRKILKGILHTEEEDRGIGWEEG
jgi:hypothetical protein